MISRSADITHGELRNIVRAANPVILEIGANDGEDTLRLLDYPAESVACFECDPRAAAGWRARVDDPRATLYEVALDEKPGVAVFHQSGGSPRDGVTDWDKSGSLCRPTGHLAYSPWCTFDNEIKVPTATLDGWARDHLPTGQIDLCWIDVQGAEMRVFRGGAETLARTRVVKVECHRTQMYEGAPSEAEMLAFFAGWRCLGRFADDMVFARDGA